MDVCAVVQQVLHHSHSIVAGGEVERRGVSALQVSTVHILRGAELLYKTEKQIRVQLLHEEKTRMLIFIVYTVYCSG